MSEIDTYYADAPGVPREKLVKLADYNALVLKLEAQRIDHPTDICECRFDFSDGVMKVRKQCAYHKGIADRLAWRPIDSAPRDGTEVLLVATIGNMLAPEPRRVVGHFARGWWADEPLSHVTHWMPLPEQPK